MQADASEDDGLELLSSRNKTIQRQFCSNCPIRSRTVGNKGPVDSPIVIVGESPGSREVLVGQPFVGESGKLLDLVMAEVGLDVEPFITNAFSCLPPRSSGGGKDKVMNDACRACHSRLLAEIRVRPRKLIIAMGNAAVRSLTGNYSAAITSIHGQLIPSELSEIGIMPMLHPAHILRNEGLTPRFLSDFSRAKDLLDGNTVKVPTLRYRVVKSKRKLYRLARLLMETGLAVGDIETTGLSRQKDEFMCIGVTPWSAEFTFPSDRIVTTYVLETIEQVNLLQAMLDGHHVEWIWHNGKFDVSFQRAKGVSRRHAVVSEDTMLLSYCLDENTGRHGLERCIIDWLGLPAYKDKLAEYVGTGKKKLSYALVPKPVLYEYLAEDCAYTGFLWSKIRPLVNADPNLNRLYEETLIPGSNALATLELNGMAVSAENGKLAEEFLLGEMTPLLAKMREMAGDTWINPDKPPKPKKGVMPEFNPESHLQVMRVLKARGLKVRDSNKDTLGSIRDDDDFVDALLTYREKQKLLSTYVKPLMEIAEKGERAYTTFNLHTTVTGRLSSSPNRQNIPKVAIIKNIVVAPKGRVLVSLDYSQAELRSLAVLSDDQRLLDIFKSGRDLHDEVATGMFGPEFTSTERRAAKTVNFGIVYGITKKALAKRLRCLIAQAQDYIDTWLGRFDKARAYIARCRNIGDAGNEDFIMTPYGRKRRFHLITSRNKHSLENQAGNHPHQSMCSDFTLDSTIQVDQLIDAGVVPKRWRKDIDLAMRGRPIQINIVHDDNVFEIDDDPVAIYHLCRVVKTVMEETPVRMGITEIPFSVDPAIGTAWGDLKETTMGDLERLATAHITETKGKVNHRTKPAIKKRDKQLTVSGRKRVQIRKIPDDYFL